MERLKASLKQWIKFSIAAIVFLLFMIWLGSWWIIIFLPLIFDVYITKFIKWDWWKDIKNPAIRTVFEWVDAIGFALIAVYFINLYLFQNYKIPTPSLEKTLLVGDHLFVSKVAYGPRTPHTPFSMPLMQHTVPILNCKSYIESIQWEARRLAGFGPVERNDIVVFNFPGGDSVATDLQQEDYESLCFKIALDSLDIRLDSIKEPGYIIHNQLIALGKSILKDSKKPYGDIIYRPIDRRENYVKRCVGLPGDTLEVKNRELYINGKKQQRLPGLQHFCIVVSKNKPTNKLVDEYNISNYRPEGMSYKEFQLIENKLMGQIEQDSMGNWNYLMGLTEDEIAKLKKRPGIISVTEYNNTENITFPVGYNSKWSFDNYGPIYIPQAGKTVNITVANLPLFERIIRNYEGNTLAVNAGKILINGKVSKTYTFKQNYYWMMGDNRHNSADSRAWGYVPEDHVVGRPVFVWLSLNPDKGWFSGKIRWSRFFKNAAQ